MDINSVFQDKPSIYEGSQQSVRSELQLFDLPPTDVTTQLSSDYVQSYPLVSVREGYNPLEFLIQMDNSGYFDASDSFLALTCRIVKQDGTVCDENDVVCPSSLFFQTTFSNLELYLNGQLVSDSGNHYSHIAYLQRLLASSPNEKNGRLKNEFFYPDITPENYTISDPGFLQRYNKTKNSQLFTMQGQLIANLFNQTRYLPSGTEIRIVLRRNLPELCLTAAYDTKAGFNGCPYNYQIINAVFYASKKVISKPIIDAHRHQLSLGHTFKFPTSETEIKTFTIAQGLTNVTTDSVVIGKIPRIIVVGLVSSTGFLGKLTKSQFNFIDKDLCELGFTWNGENIEHRVFPFNFRKGKQAATSSSSVAADGEPSTEKADTTTTKPLVYSGVDDFLLALRSLSRTAANPSLGNGIDRDNYTKGNVLTAVELLPNSGNALSVNRRGQIKLQLKFREPLDEPVNVVIYAQYQSIVEIDSNKQIIFDH